MTPTKNHSAVAERVQTDPFFKGAYARSLHTVQYENFLLPENLRNEYCKEIFMTIPSVIYSRKNFFLLHSLNVKLEMLKNGGFISYWQHRFSDEKKYARAQQQQNAKAMEFHQLLGCFQILLIGCAMSICVFLLELSKKTKKNQ